MQFIPIKTRAMLPPQDDIYSVLDEYLPELQEGDLLFITSKVLGIHQGRCVKIEEGTKEEKDKLIRQEADYYIPRQEVPNEYAFLTIKDHTLISSAGIDKSNSNGYYVFWPQEVNKLLKEIRSYLQKKYNIKNLALISVDSHSVPMRVGTMGISTGFYGLEPIIDIRGREDIFGRPLKVTRMNIVDGLSATAVMLMGESNEQTPLLVGRGMDFVKFSDQDHYNDLIIDPEEDMFYPVIKNFRKNDK